MMSVYLELLSVLLCSPPIIRSLVITGTTDFELYEGLPPVSSL